MIFGVGTDIVSLSRLEKMDNLEKFAMKVLSEKELAIFTNLVESKKITYLAKQFAVKRQFQKHLEPECHYLSCLKI